MGSTGFLTERQLQVLRLRAQSLSQEEVSKRLGTTRENISVVEKRAEENIRKARATLDALKNYGISVSITVKPGTHLVDIPRLILDKADEANIKVRANFVKMYEDIRFKARDKVRRVKVAKPITIRIMPDGDLHVE